MEDLVKGIVLMAIGLIAIGLSVSWASAVLCDGRWDEYEHEWSVTGGCRVLTEYGYLPEDNIRMNIDDVIYIGAGEPQS